MKNEHRCPLPSPSEVYDDIKSVSDRLGIEPADLTLSKYNKGGGQYDGRTLRRLGGYASLVASRFGSGKTVNELVITKEVKNASKYVKSLEDQIVSNEMFRAQLTKAWEDVIERTGAIQVSKLSKPESSKKNDTALERANVAFVSDIHLGALISRDEVGNNQFDWQIGARRLGKYAEQVASYKIEHRDQCDTLHVCLGGDLGQGVIHPDDGADDITYQCWGITKYLVQMIDYWRSHYKYINVEFTPDNHMRMPHRGPDRNLHNKIDNFSTFGVLQPLQYAFRECDDVNFHVTKNGITTFNVLGHKFGMTHGDTHINTGSVSKAIDVRSISTQVLKLNADQIRLDGSQYDAILVGHVHSALFMHLNEASTYLVVNGTGSGTDGYAFSVGYYRTRPQQVLFEVTRQHAVGDFRIISLDDADTEGRYEKIVKPYQYELGIK